MTNKQIIITNKRQGKNIYNIIDDKTELIIKSKKFGDVVFIIDTNLIDLLKEYKQDHIINLLMDLTN